MLELNGIFYINKAFYVFLVLSKDYFPKFLNNSKKVSLGCSNVVLYYLMLAFCRRSCAYSVMLVFRYLCSYLLGLDWILILPHIIIELFLATIIIKQLLPHLIEYMFCFGIYNLLLAS